MFVKVVLLVFSHHMYPDISCAYHMSRKISSFSQAVMFNEMFLPAVIIASYVNGYTLSVMFLLLIEIML